MRGETGGTVHPAAASQPAATLAHTQPASGCQHISQAMHGVLKLALEARQTALPETVLEPEWLAVHVQDPGGPYASSKVVRMVLSVELHEHATT